MRDKDDSQLCSWGSLEEWEQRYLSIKCTDIEKLISIILDRSTLDYVPNSCYRGDGKHAS